MLGTPLKARPREACSAVDGLRSLVSGGLGDGLAARAAEVTVQPVDRTEARPAEILRGLVLEGLELGNRHILSSFRPYAGLDSTKKAPYLVGVELAAPLREDGCMAQEGQLEEDAPLTDVDRGREVSR